MDQQLHILFLCGWYPSKVMPTNGDFIQRHAEAVATKNKVTVLHIISDDFLTEKKRIEVDKKNNVHTFIGYIKKTKNPLLKIYRYFSIFKEILAQIDDFQVVHLNTLYPFGLFALHLKKTEKIPFIISEHWTGYHNAQSKNIGFFRKKLSKIITKKAAFVCPVTSNLASSMQNFGLNGNYTVVPNVVDTHIFIPNKKTPNEFTIIHISSLRNQHKNISGMLEVAKQLENSIGKFTWKFIGGTDENFKNLIEKLNFTAAKIEFINHIDQKDVVSHLQNASVFVLFSNYENLPCVILESFSCGIPVISTNVGGIAEFFPDDFGTLIQPNNQKALLENLILYASKTNELKEKMHTYAVNNFSKQTIEKQFSKLYHQSIKTTS